MVSDSTPCTASSTATRIRSSRKPPTWRWIADSNSLGHGHASSSGCCFTSISFGPRTHEKAARAHAMPASRICASTFRTTAKATKRRLTIFGVCWRTPLRTDTGRRRMSQPPASTTHQRRFTNSLCICGSSPLAKGESRWLPDCKRTPSAAARVASRLYRLLRMRQHEPGSALHHRHQRSAMPPADDRVRLPIPQAERSSTTAGCPKMSARQGIRPRKPRFPHRLRR